MTPEHADSEIPDGDPGVPDLTPEHLRRALEAIGQKGPNCPRAAAGSDPGPQGTLRQAGAAPGRLRARARRLPDGRPGAGAHHRRHSGPDRPSRQYAWRGEPAVDGPSASTGRSSRRLERLLRQAVRRPWQASVGNAPARLSPVCAVLGGRFELEECVGKGGTADVYRARDLLADQYDREHSTVAVKVLHRELHGDPPLLREILRAAAAMRRLRHAAIAQVFEVHHLDGDYLVVSEWLEGESLAQRLDGRAHPALGAAELGAARRGHRECARIRAPARNRPWRHQAGKRTS